jgi:hypothetical protein
MQKETPSRIAQSHVPGRNTNDEDPNGYHAAMIDAKIAEAEALAEHGSCQRTGSGSGGTKILEFDGSTSRTVFRRKY